MQAQPIDFRISPNETNIIKGIAICAMLIHHLFYETNAYGYCIQQIGIICKVCVSIFLFVSGYGLTIQYSKKSHKSLRNRISNTLKFLLKRFSKFYLNYWAIFIILVPLGVFVFGKPLSASYGTVPPPWQSLIKDILGIQGMNSYIMTWWFNALIVSLYLLFPFLLWLMKRDIISVGFIILLILWPREHFVGNFFYIFELWNPNLAVYTLVFALGIFSAIHIEHINNILNKISIVTTFIFSLLLAIAFCFIRQIWAIEFIDAIAVDALITFFTVVLIISFRRLTNFQMKLFVFLGRHSMNIYLIHTFILMFFFPRIIFETKNPIIIFATLLTESIIFSTLLELAKRKLNFYKLQDWIRCRIQ